MYGIIAFSASCNSMLHNGCNVTLFVLSEPHEHVSKDETFLQTIIPRAEKFFKLCVLPELLGRLFFLEAMVLKYAVMLLMYLKWKRINETWCDCKEPKGCDMICCDSNGFNIRWFHFGCCIQMADSSRAKWL